VEILTRFGPSLLTEEFADNARHPDGAALGPHTPTELSGQPRRHGSPPFGGQEGAVTSLQADLQGGICQI